MSTGARETLARDAGAAAAVGGGLLYLRHGTYERAEPRGGNFVKGRLHRLHACGWVNREMKEHADRFELPEDSTSHEHDDAMPGQEQSPQAGCSFRVGH